MRELKFRVYIPDYEKFCYFTLGDFNYSDRYLHQHSYPVQQYTGLKDKNGKEIYESDILEYQSHDPKYTRVLVRWTDESYDNHPGWIITDSYSQYGKPEIIGNIFETPELLK